MPEVSTKNQSKKGKNEPKEQRRPRQARQQNHNTPVDKKPEKNIATPKVSVPEKPTFVDPGPEFYKNLKRETDEILKITEEASSKYKKKEIQSNWAKYEIPIESYEEIDEQENMGADYEKLAETPVSIGGYFQFKHEKSWDINTEPSLYDKFFEIDMDNLNIAVQTTPFHQRNCIDKSIFSDSDIQNMNNRSMRFKQKYFKDKSYTTPELQAQEKIVNSLRENTIKFQDNDKDDKNKTTEGKCGNHIAEDKKLDSIENINEVSCNKQEKNIANNETKKIHEQIELTNPEQNKESSDDSYNTPSHNIKLLSTDTIIPNKVESVKEIIITHPIGTEAKGSDNRKKTDDLDDIIFEIPGIKVHDPVVEKPSTERKNTEIPIEVASPVPELKSNPVIESPEYLEKWLDDFLDS